MEERTLIEKLNRHSRGALDQAVAQFTPYVSAVILRALAGRACREDLEELCADVFVALWAHADTLDPEAEKGLRPWLAAVAKNKATDFLRRQRPSAPIPEDAPDPSPGPEELVQRRDQSARLWAAVDGLGEPDRTLFVRYYYEGDKLKIIAAELGLSQTAAKQRLFLGRKALRAVLQGRSGDAVKNRLRSLWDEVMPEGGPCPQPDGRAVRRRVDAALDAGRRTFHLRRKLKLAALCAAALVLLTGAAAVTEMVLAPPTYNVLSVFFRGDAAPWEDLMDFQPVSVSDDDYTLTVTSTLADKSTLFYTFTVEAHSDEAWEALELQKRESFYDLFSFRPDGTLSIGGETDPESRTWHVQICTGRGWGTAAAVRLDLMEKGKWLSFSYRPVSDLKLNIGAEGQGSGGWAYPDLTGPVTLKRLTLSPLTIEAEYTTEQVELFPALWFLWEDGTVSEVGSLLGGAGHGSGQGTVGEAWDYTRSYSFDLVQDLSQLEAVVFGGLAYPVDKGAPYEVDLDALAPREAAPQP